MSAREELDWRPIDPGQVGAWAALINLIEVADGQDDFVSEQELLEHFGDPNIDFARGSVSVCDGDQMVGYGLVASRVTPDGVHALRHHGGVHPGYRGRGLGARLLGWAQTAATGLHQDLRPGRPLTLGSRCQQGNEAALVLHQALGFEPSRWFHRMVCDLSDGLPWLRMPAEVEITGFTPGRSQDARLIRNEAFSDHWGSSPLDPQEWEHFLSSEAFRPRYTFLAYLRGEPIGLVVGNEYEAYAQTTGLRDLYIPVVGTREAGRKRGIATALVVSALSAARTDGFAQASLDVDADSPTGAVGLYRRIGFTARDSSVVMVKTLIG